MRLCIPVSEPDGRDWLIAPDFHHAKHLIFFDTETRLYDAISLRELRTGENANIEADALLCTTINPASLQSLIAQGVIVYGTEARTVAEAVACYEDGKLAPAVAEAGGCGGHGHAHGHRGACCSGDGAHGNRHDGPGAHHCGSGGGACGGGQGSECGDGHPDSACCAGHGSWQPPVACRPRGESFRIAVCSQNRKTVTEHAGKCRKFWIFEIRQGEVVGKELLELPIEESLHATPAGEAHPLDSVNVLITSGMGSGLQQRLLRHGVEAVVTNEEDPAQAVAAYLAGETQADPVAQTRC